jgi:pyruvate dehydrogenase E2 component (dihydrolipoamide acetyltransferase)
MMGVVTLNAEPALAFLSKVNDEKNNTTGTKVTMTAYTGKVLGLAMAKYPRMNVRLLWGKIFPHETVDVSFLVAIGNDSDSKTPDLAQVKVSQINERSMVEIAKLLGGGARELRSGTNKEYNKTKETVQAIPTFLLKYIVNFAGWLSSAAGYGSFSFLTFSVSIPALGVNAFPFGSCIVTSLGPLGVEEALIPPTPYVSQNHLTK